MKYEGFLYIVINFSPHSADGGYIKVSTRIFVSEHPMEVFREYKGGCHPYEKMVLIGIDLYKHLKESNCSVANITQTVRNSSGLESSSNVKSITPRSWSPTIPLAVPSQAEPLPGKPLGDVRREAEGDFSRIRTQSPTSSQKKELPSKSFDENNTSPEKSSLSPHINEKYPDEKINKSSIEKKNKKTGGKSPRVLPAQKARRETIYGKWGV